MPRGPCGDRTVPRRKHFLLTGEGWPYLLVPLIPVAVVLEFTHAGATWVFLASALGVIPTAALMGRATEELAARPGPVLPQWADALEHRSRRRLNPTAQVVWLALSA